MSVLTEQDRVEIWEEWMRKNADPLGSVLKLDVRQAVDDLDIWFDNNKASALAAISEPAKSELTNSQIALLSTMIVGKRWVKGS